SSPPWSSEIHRRPPCHPADRRITRTSRSGESSWSRPESSSPCTPSDGGRRRRRIDRDDRSDAIAPSGRLHLGRSDAEEEGLFSETCLDDVCVFRRLLDKPHIECVRVAQDHVLPGL